MHNLVVSRKKENPWGHLISYVVVYRWLNDDWLFPSLNELNLIGYNPVVEIVIYRQVISALNFQRYVKGTYPISGDFGGTWSVIFLTYGCVSNWCSLWRVVEKSNSNQKLMQSEQFKHWCMGCLPSQALMPQVNAQSFCPMFILTWCFKDRNSRWRSPPSGKWRLVRNGQYAHNTRGVILITIIPALITPEYVLTPLNQSNMFTVYFALTFCVILQ